MLIGEISINAIFLIKKVETIKFPVKIKLHKITIKEVILLSLSNFIETILNIQDNNISFTEEDYCQVTQKSDYLIKIFKDFLKSYYSTCSHCNSKNIVKNGLRIRKIRYIPI